MKNLIYILVFGVIVVNDFSSRFQAPRDGKPYYYGGRDSYSREGPRTPTLQDYGISGNVIIDNRTPILMEPPEDRK